MTNMIWAVLNLFGISAPPVTVQEFLWDLVIIFIGLTLIKTVISFIFGFLKDTRKF